MAQSNMRSRFNSNSAQATIRQAARRVAASFSPTFLPVPEFSARFIGGFGGQFIDRGFDQSNLAPDAGGGSGGGAGAGGAAGGTGGGAGDPAGGTGGAGGAGQPDMSQYMPKVEATKAFTARDKARAEAAEQRAAVVLFAKTLQIDPDTVRVTKTEDPENPYTLEAPGLDDVTKAIAEAKQARLDKQKKAGDWDTREKELEKKYTTEIQTRAQKHAADIKAKDESFVKERAAYHQWIKDNAVTTPIRAACAQEDAIDDTGDGSFSDLVTLLMPRIKTEIGVDEETGEPRVIAQPMKPDGTPLLDSKGNPASIRQLVKEFLDAKKHLRKSNFRSGPGAGQGVNGNHGGGTGRLAGTGVNGQAAPNGQAVTGGRAAAAYAFGM